AGLGARLALSDGETVHGIDRDTGEKQWSTDLDSPDRPAVVGDSVLVGADGVVALDLADGSERWRIDDVSAAMPLGNGVLARRRDELIACTACEN
ncbi:PQQ-binding-like beta-propeller repeat protein, partial [Halolamina salina]